MLGKIILTLLVIFAAVIVIKQRSQEQQPPDNKLAPVGKPPVDKMKKETSSGSQPVSDFRLAAYLFLILMFGAAALLYYQSWQDDHTILTVTLVRDGNSPAVTYEVYKYQLESRRFTTIEGTLITVADSERMEVLGLGKP
ncbi:MAG: hypothetical protein JKY98_05000 [Gammaproteobacteria bacterium]|nr:hypothetical protein [Gammaproteobacteria bacterium]